MHICTSFLGESRMAWGGVRVGGAQRGMRWMRSRGRSEMRLSHTMPANKQLQRTATRRRGAGASAPFHCALAPRIMRQRAAAELRRYTP